MSKNKATHSCSIVQHFHQCPKCRLIMESREDFERQFDRYSKELHCERCGHRFIDYKNRPGGFSPLLGEDKCQEYFETLRPDASYGE